MRLSYLKKKNILSILKVLGAYLAGSWIIIEAVQLILIKRFKLPVELLDITFIILLGLLICIIVWKLFRKTKRNTRKIKVELYFLPIIIIITVILNVMIIMGINEPKLDLDSKKKISEMKKTFFITILSSPQGAQIFVNGQFKGLTDNTIILPQGEYEIHLKKEAHKVFKDKINITKNQILSILLKKR